jgi:hypothetical protein
MIKCGIIEIMNTLPTSHDSESDDSSANSRARIVGELAGRTMAIMQEAISRRFLESTIATDSQPDETPETNPGTQ